MSTRERARWDAYYRAVQQGSYPEPDPLLFLYTPPLPYGEERRALDLAGGVGQNALWLAEQGYTTDLIDISRVALRRAYEEVHRRCLRTVNLFQVDLGEVILQPETFDLVSVFRYFNPALLPGLRAAVKPGGRVIYETYTIDYLRQMPTADVNELLEPGELLGFFGDWHILHHVELPASSQVVARKPE